MTTYHYNATNGLPQTNPATRIAFNNPIVAFGERVGGTGLASGNDKLHLDEFATVRPFLAGDGAQGKILLARVVQQIAEALVPIPIYGGYAAGSYKK